MSYIELFGIRKLKCPKCNHIQTFDMGGNPEYFSQDFSIEERTCKGCNNYIWEHPDIYAIFTDEWNITELINVTVDEIKNQNKHDQLKYPIKLSKILELKNVPINDIKDIIAELFNDILN